MDERILEALNLAGVRYVVVGGLAVTLHGYARLTVDLDLVIELTSENTLAAVRALESLGYIPGVPVRSEEFADAEQRAAWIRDKGMKVFPMYHRDDPTLRVNLFVDYPIAFEELWTDSVIANLGSLTTRVAGLDHLLQMKRDAGRPKDLIDIEELEKIRSERGQ